MQSQTDTRNRGLRRKLLGTASALALLGLSQFPSDARAADSGDADFHLTLVVASQFTMTDGGKTIYGDAFEPPPAIGTNDGGDGFVALNLEREGWIFGAAFNFGRTGTSHGSFTYSTKTLYNYYDAAGQVHHTESHKILDFTIGRDVGLGMFGLEGSSVVSGGIEWANFSATTIGDFSYASKYYSTSFSRVIRRHFNGIGPVISWDASTPFGNPDCPLTLNWGANASVLFGTRKIFVESSSGNDFRSNHATVPRVGGYLSVGWHPMDSVWSLSAGYAVSASWSVFDGNFDDDGDEVRNNVDRITHGPFVALTVKIQ